MMIFKKRWMCALLVFLVVMMCERDTLVLCNSDENDYTFLNKDLSGEAAQHDFNWDNFKHNPLGQSFIHLDGDRIWIYGSFWDYRIRDREAPNNHQQRAPIINDAPYVRTLLIGPYIDFNEVLAQAECIFYYDTDTDSDFEKAPLTSMYASHVDDIYSENLARPYFITCKPPSLDERVPLAMSLIFPGQSTAGWSKDTTGIRRYYIWPIRGLYDSKMQTHDHSSNKYIDISTKIQQDKIMKHEKNPLYPLKKLMICVKPARNGIFYDYRLMISFLTYYNTMGVTNFLFMDTGSFSPRIYKIFNIASKMGIFINVQTWAMRETHGWENHQVLFNEVCVYYAMDEKYDNMAIVDFDEYIIPRVPIDQFGHLVMDNDYDSSISNTTITAAHDSNKFPNLLEYIDALDQQFPDASNYKFQQACFLRKDNFDTIKHINDIGDSHNKIKKAAETLVFFNNIHEIGPVPNRRTKHIYKPYRIGEIFVHSTTAANGNYKEIQIKENLGGFHHYRFKCEGGEAVGRYDKRMHDQYQDILYNNTFLAKVIEYVDLI
jgi:hypothetical protein